eukprot:9396190-Alexandrium_andersonii.AAC.1
MSTASKSSATVAEMGPNQWRLIWERTETRPRGCPSGGGVMFSAAVRGNGKQTTRFALLEHPRLQHGARCEMALG